MKNTLLIALLSCCTQAFATGGIDCNIDDANLKANFGGVLSHSIPSAPFQVYGEVTLKIQFLSESIVITFLAFFVAFLLAELTLPLFNSLTGKHF